MSLPVVLVHGLRTSRTMWRAQLAALERVGRRAVAVDLPGHGARVAEPFTLDAAVDTVAEAIETVGGEAFVVGLSLGGYVGIRHAARRPGQVAGLLAASCSTQPHRLLLGGWSVGARGIALLPDRGARLNRFLVDLALPPDGARDVGAGGFALDVTNQVLREMTVATPLEDLARVEAPVWLVNGAFDHFRGEERRFLAACRDGRLVVVPRATHLVSLVQPARFTRVMLEALDQVDDRAGVGRSAAG
ncbi:alpha/beta fold hydrolase [Cellulomonas sp. ICMP 17802]|uniref:alpha/beta fold hydrolase n=1 Tax=Cellulomonas sp. ICMP 17802 TaxID=3239199 RepID=UPI00351B4819